MPYSQSYCKNFVTMRSHGNNLVDEECVMRAIVHTLLLTGLECETLLTVQYSRQ